MSFNRNEDLDFNEYRGRREARYDGCRGVEIQFVGVLGFEFFLARGVFGSRLC